jgi:hypothetical protein
VVQILLFNGQGVRHGDGASSFLHSKGNIVTIDEPREHARSLQRDCANA